MNFTEYKKQIIKDAKQTKSPVIGQFELTPRCNLDCKMCYVHNQDSNKLAKQELSTEKWKEIFDQAFDAGLMFATLTGGECTLRNDFKELYLYLWYKGVSITVLTNGTLIDDSFLCLREFCPLLFQL